METTYDNLPKQIDYLILELAEIRKILLGNIMKPEEVPKNLIFNEALSFLDKLAYPISESKLYKLTSSGSIPYHKIGNKLIFRSVELERWVNDLIINSEKTENIENQIIKMGIKNNRRYGK